MEDIALDAHLDDAGRLVAATNVRRIAANLAINTDTAARHLARLRDYGFVWQEEGGQTPSGRWETCRYVLDPSACLERFTHTPNSGRPTDPPSGAAATGVDQRCPTDAHTASAATVSEATGHGRFGHNSKKKPLVQEEQQPPSPRVAPVGSLVELGVDPAVAAQLTTAHPPERIAAVAAAARHRQVRNLAGWARTALVGDWALAANAAAREEPPPATPELRQDPDCAGAPPATPTGQEWAATIDAVVGAFGMSLSMRDPWRWSSVSPRC